MAETSMTLSSATNESYGKRDEADDDMIKVESESEVVVKLEPAECAACGAAGGRELLEPEGGLGASLARFARGALSGRLLCRACAELVRLLARAEAEYLRLRDAFDAVLAGNPLYRAAPASCSEPDPAPAVKREPTPPAPDSEDEPLARSRRKHSNKGIKKKKKANSIKPKRKDPDSIKLYEWECEECGTQGTGDEVALAAHRLALHALPDVAHIKTEDLPDGDMSQSPYNNGLENGADVTFGDFDDDDEDSTFNPDDFLTQVEPKKKSRVGQKQRKTWHPCGQCNARFSSLIRLEQHRLKHDGSKPPYICEVCGAHYKHKRACDIHIALHKGISDWKCEECNKLFPSKNALQRHNNIHTGKLNYQCDLCGKSFIHTSSFKMHKLSHSGVKPHACDVCGLALMTRSHLKRHKRIHSGEKRHECAVCGKRFSERYNLAAHAKSHETPAPPADPAPRRRLFRCHFCTERFERRYMLERHMSVLHGRTLERPPPTPRNTMSKLLKAQAQARQGDAADADTKEEREAAGEGRAPLAPAKLLAQLSSSSLAGAGSWAGAYAAEFQLRPDFPH